MVACEHGNRGGLIRGGRLTTAGSGVSPRKVEGPGALPRHYLKIRSLKTRFERLFEINLTPNTSFLKAKGFSK